MSVTAQKLEVAAKIMKLQRLALKNFKGLKNFTFEPNGNDITLLGENASGKSTLYDAYLWLLFGKDSSNSTDFSIKPQDSTGQDIHFLETEVEAVFQVNGKPLALRKMLKENWVKKRGQQQQEYKGNTTEQWVDDVPAKAGEYKQAISNLIDENLFKLITNPLYFNTQVKWLERRSILMEIASDIPDVAVIASDPKLSKLTEILAGKSINDYKKILNEKIKKLQEDVAKIPIRIDELNSTLAGEEVDYSEIEAELASKKEYLQHLEEELVSASAISDAYRQKQNELTRLYQEQNRKRTELSRAANAEHDKLMSESMSMQRKISLLKADIEGSSGNIKTAEDMINSNKLKAAELRQLWQEIHAEIVKAPDASALTCPTCNQDLPGDQRESMISQAKENFDANKKLRLQNITAQGKVLVETNAKHQEKVNSFRSDIETKKGQLVEAENALIAINNKLESPREEVDVESHPEYKAIQVKIDALLAELQKPVEDVTGELFGKKRLVTTEIEALNFTLNNKDVRTKTLARIEELKQQEKELAKQISKLDGEKFLLEEFIKAKVNLLEDSINNRFKAVRFKLFDVQINGAVVECCEAMVNTNGSWVPYSDANNAAKINCGMDIINTLTQYYGVSAPIFVDNAEAVNDLLPISSQVIRLVVSRDKTLRVEGM